MKTLGMLRLDTRFPRIEGDCCHKDTWQFPMLEACVEGASATRIVCEQGQGVIDSFIRCGLQLRDKGAVGLVSSCGFMSLHVDEIQAGTGLPCMLSSLQILPRLLGEYGSVGVMTLSATNLTPEHFHKVGVDAVPPIAGVDRASHFAEVIFDDLPEMDIEQACSDNVATALRLQGENPDIRAILLECTNMPPYASAITSACGLPVYSLIDAVTNLYEAI